MKIRILHITFFCIICLHFVSGFYINNSYNKIVNYNGNNLLISIDGVSSSSLPSSGNYYLIDYGCDSLNTKIIWDRIKYKLNISNENKNASVSCNLVFKSNPLLSEMPVASYVLYEGNNGCEGNHCKGYNANYTDDDLLGNCFNNIQFYFKGWRIGYIEDNSSVLISAGAPECMCTSADGVSLVIGCSSGSIDDLKDKHINNMNNIALKYCNSNYIKNGECSSNAINNNYVVAMNEYHYYKITGSSLDSKLNSSSNCYGKRGVKTCGYNNNLIDIGSWYWFAHKNYHWYPGMHQITNLGYSYSMGVRPVLTLDSSVIVTGGDGTYENPYLIDNNYFIVGDGSGILNSNNDLSNVELSFNSIVDVSKMCISVDTSSCSNYIDYSDTYSLDLSNAGTGEKIIYVYYKDAYNKIVAAMQRTIVINNES